MNLMNLIKKLPVVSLSSLWVHEPKSNVEKFIQYFNIINIICYRTYKIHIQITLYGCRTYLISFSIAKLIIIWSSVWFYVHDVHLYN